MFSLQTNGFTRSKKRKKSNKTFIPIRTSSTGLDQGEYKLMYKLRLQYYCWTEVYFVSHISLPNP